MISELLAMERDEHPWSSMFENAEKAGKMMQEVYAFCLGLVRMTMYRRSTGVVGERPSVSHGLGRLKQLASRTGSNTSI